MKRSEWNRPGFYQAQPRLHFLGGGQSWVVNLNNHTDVENGLSERDARFRAAIRNYENGSYPYPQSIGLDGIE